MPTRKKCGECLFTVLLISLSVLLLPILAKPKSPARGTIAGTVLADQGQVRGFRVTAHNLRSMIWYVVFTKDGKYNVPQALPGPTRSASCRTATTRQCRRPISPPARRGR